MSRKKHISICTEGWYYVGVFAFITAGAIIRDINLLFILAGMMLGPLVLSVLLVSLTLRRLTFSRRLPRAIGAGDLLVVDLQARSDLYFGGSWAVVVDDQIEKITDPVWAPGTARLFYCRVPPRGMANAFYRVRLHERGRYRLGPIRALTRIPMGLMQATTQADVVDEILVCPQLGRMLPGWRQRLQISRERGFQTHQQHGRAEGDYYGMRDWRSGDNRRWIHWRTSAKRNTLAVKQFEHTVNQDLTVLVDLGRPSSSTPAQHAATVETLISLAATILAEECRLGSSQLALGTAGDTPCYLRGTSSLVFHQEVMEHLAVVQAGRRDSLPDLLAIALPQVPRDGRIVLVSARGFDGHDRTRFARLDGDHRAARLLHYIVPLDVRGDSLHDFFDPPTRATPSPPVARSTGNGTAGQDAVLLAREEPGP